VISAVRPAPIALVDDISNDHRGHDLQGSGNPPFPDRVIAGHHADLLASSFHGINEATSEFLHRQLRAAGAAAGAPK